MSKVIKFTLRPHGVNHYVTVRIFPTKDAMRGYVRRYFKRTGHPEGKTNFIGLFMGYERIRARDSKMLNDIGQVLLVRGSCNHGITAHELGHAAIHYERVVHGNKAASMGKDIGEREERMLHTLHDLVEGFHEKVTVNIAA